MLMNDPICDCERKPFPDTGRGPGVWPRLVAIFALIAMVAFACPLTAGCAGSVDKRQLEAAEKLCDSVLVEYDAWVKVHPALTPDQKTRRLNTTGDFYDATKTVSDLAKDGWKPIYQPTR